MSPEPRTWAYATVGTADLRDKPFKNRQCSWDELVGNRSSHVMESIEVLRVLYIHYICLEPQAAILSRKLIDISSHLLVDILHHITNQHAYYFEE